MAILEYDHEKKFPGVVGRTVDQSQPAWPRPIRAKKGSPNVLFIVIDDMGFAQLGCYGSPIDTPNIDKLAADGLLYSNMHTTALCSPTRSCILTGRNHHSNGVSCVMEMSTGYPGANGIIPFENGFLSEILLQKGYNTYAVGKWHLTPAGQTSAAGPFDRWPLGRGFERFYGFLGGDTSQYYPDLIYDNHQVMPEKTPEEGYHLTEDITDKAISFILDSKQVAPDKPFFMYFCPGAMHAPHHVPKEWIDKYKGKFDGGWEVYREETFARQKELGIIPQDAEISSHDPDVQRWDSLPADEKKLYARMMEVYAGFLTHMDYHIGRLLDHLKKIDEFDNTLIMFISDNGASPEGGPTGSLNENHFFNNVTESLEDNMKAIDDLGGPKYFNHYPWGWTWAGNTPFRRWKRETYRGGVSDPFIVHWPKGIKSKGGVRGQFTHAIDMLPTVLDLLDIEAPETIRGATQSPIEGVSFAHTLENADAPTKHITQYFEIIGHRSIYHDGWRAVCPWPGAHYAETDKEFGAPISKEELMELDAHHWELYHVDKDVAENNNVAGENRDKLIELISQWYVEAGKYNVLPVDGRAIIRALDERPAITEKRTSSIFFPGTQSVPSQSAVSVLNVPHTITADVVIPEEGAEGVLLCQGGNVGGMSLYIKRGKLNYVHNYVGNELFHLESDVEVPAGRHLLSYEFIVTGPPDLDHGKGTPGIGKLFIDGKQVGEMILPVTVPITMSLDSGISCGREESSPITPDYEVPFEFTGTIDHVTIDVSGEHVPDPEAEMRIIMARQ